MRRSIGILAALAAIVLGSLVMIPAGISGAASGSLWVANGAPLGADTSCSSPGYSTIQSAIDHATTNQTIEVCAGTYTEQLTITKGVSLVAVGAATVALPAAPADATTACDTAIDGSAPGQDEISICGTGTVKITGLTVQALWPANTCNDNLYGILVAGGARLDATNVDVDGAGASPINGCQGGVGIEVGVSGLTPAETGTAVLSHVTVSNYQKNGITVDGTGSAATISNAFVTGAGATPVIAQNGIQISDGAVGVIKSSTITGDECDYPDGVCGPDSLSNAQSTSVLFYGAGAGSSLSKSSVSDSDIGAYYVSGAASEPTSAEVTIKSNIFNDNRYEGVVLDAGVANVTGNTIDGTGNVGIQVLQYAGQPYAPASTASKDTITGQGVGVQVLSDNQAGDLPGNFTISHSTFRTGNTVAEEDNSTNYTLGGVHNT
jgi:hypothetical protein